MKLLQRLFSLLVLFLCCRSAQAEIMVAGFDPISGLTFDFAFDLRQINPLIDPPLDITVTGQNPLQLTIDLQPPFIIVNQFGTFIGTTYADFSLRMTGPDGETFSLTEPVTEHFSPHHLVATGTLGHRFDLDIDAFATINGNHVPPFLGDFDGSQPGIGTIHYLVFLEPDDPPFTVDVSFRNPQASDAVPEPTSGIVFLAGIISLASYASGRRTRRLSSA